MLLHIGVAGRGLVDFRVVDNEQNLIMAPVSIVYAWRRVASGCRHSDACNTQLVDTRPMQRQE